MFTNEIVSFEQLGTDIKDLIPWLLYLILLFTTANPQPVLVTGDPGSGKSALLCNLVARLKQDKSYAVVYHFIGFAEGSTG